MRAHQLDKNGVIINTIEVESISVLPNLFDASIGGSKGDSIVDGVLIPKQADIRANIIAQISEIENSNPITHRALREMALGTFEMFNVLIGYCNTLEERISTLEGAPPAPQPAIQPPYGVQLANEINNQIATLRAQL